MFVTIWILFIFFSLIGISFFIKLFTDRLNWFEALMMFVAVIFGAILAGFLFGGLVIPFLQDVK